MDKDGYHTRSSLATCVAVVFASLHGDNALSRHLAPVRSLAPGHLGRAQRSHAFGAHHFQT